MVTTYVGDMTSAFAFRAKNLSLKTEMQRLSTELTTGQTTDIAKKFSGNLSLVSGIDTSLARIKGYTAQTQEAGLFTTTMQAGLQTIDSLALQLRQSPAGHWRIEPQYSHCFWKAIAPYSAVPQPR